MAKKPCGGCPHSSCKCPNRVPIIIVLKPGTDTTLAAAILKEIAPDFDFGIYALKDRLQYTVFGTTSPETIKNVFKAEVEIAEKEYPNLNGPPRKIRFWKAKSELQAPDRLAASIERVFIPMPSIVLTD